MGLRRPARIDGAAERLDETGHAPRTLEQSLDHIAAVNRWLGARRALLKHLLPRLPNGRPRRVLDVGTGAADLPLAIATGARRRGLAVRLVALDLHPQIVTIARNRAAGESAIHIVRSDALRLPFADAAFDFALLSTTLHHFEGQARAAALRELGRVGATVIVGDLERCWPNYIGARALAATVWRSNPITRHDGPLSVRRAFTADELLDAARQARLRAPRVHRHVFHRLVLVAGGRDA